MLMHFAGRFDTVLVYKLDRLGRDTVLTIGAVRDLSAAGARVRSRTEAFDVTTPSGEFFLTILAGIGGFERQTILARAKEGTNRLARLGTWLGGVVPYGYRVDGKGRERCLVIADDPQGQEYSGSEE